MSVEVAYLVNVAVQKCYAELDELVQTLQRSDDFNRKRKLAEFFQKQRLIFTRLIVLLKWCEGSEAVKQCHMIQGQLHQQSLSYFNAAVTLGNFHSQLWQKRAPPFAVPTAVDVMVSGTYSRFPKLGDEIWKGAKEMDSAEQKATFAKLNNLIRLRLTYSKVPSGIKSVRVANGRVYLEIGPLALVTLTLFGPRMSDPWRVLAVKVLTHPAQSGKSKKSTTNTGTKTGTAREMATSLSKGTTLPNMEVAIHSNQDSSGTAVPEVTEQHLNFLVHELQLQMNTLPTDPLGVIYNITCFFALSVQLVYLHEQARVLVDGPWAGLVTIRYQPGIKLTLLYWETSEAATANKLAALPGSKNKPAASGKSYSRIEVALPINGKDDVTPSNRLVVTHEPRLTDPALSVADMYVNDAQTHIHIEHLFNSAVYLHVHKRLQDLREALLLHHAHFFSAEEPYGDVYITEGPALHIHYDRVHSAAQATEHTYAIQLKTDSRTGTWQVEDLSSVLHDKQSTELLRIITTRLNSVDIFESLPQALVLLRQELVLIGVRIVARDLGLDVFERLPTLTPVVLPEPKRPIKTAKTAPNTRPSTNQNTPISTPASTPGPSTNHNPQNANWGRAPSALGTSSVSYATTSTTNATTRPTNNGHNVHAIPRVIYVRVYGAATCRFCAFRVKSDFSMEAFDISATAMGVSNSVLQIDRVTVVSYSAPYDKRSHAPKNTHSHSNSHSHSTRQHTDTDVHTRETTRSKRRMPFQHGPDKRAKLAHITGSAKKCAFRSESMVRRTLRVIRVVAELAELCAKITAHGMEYIILTNQNGSRDTRSSAGTNASRNNTGTDLGGGKFVTDTGLDLAQAYTKLSEADSEAGVGSNLDDLVLQLVSLPPVAMTGTPTQTPANPNPVPGLAPAPVTSATDAVRKMVAKYLPLLNMEIRSVVVRSVHNAIPMTEMETSAGDVAQISWQVEVVLSNALMAVNRGRTGGGHVTFDSSCNVLFLRYPDRSDASFARFRGDWERFVMASVLCLQYTQAMETYDSTHRLRAVFHVGTFDYTSVRVRYASMVDLPTASAGSVAAAAAASVGGVGGAGAGTKEGAVVATGTGPDSPRDRSATLTLVVQWIPQTKKYLVVFGGETVNPHAAVTPFMQQRLNVTSDLLVLLDSICTSRAMFRAVWTISYPRAYWMGHAAATDSGVDHGTYRLHSADSPSGYRTLSLPCTSAMQVQRIPRAWDKMVVLFNVSSYAVVVSATNEDFVLIEPAHEHAQTHTHVPTSAHTHTHKPSGASDGGGKSKGAFRPMPYLMHIANAVLAPAVPTADAAGQQTPTKLLESDPPVTTKSGGKAIPHKLIAVPVKRCTEVFGALAEFQGALLVIELLRNYAPKTTDMSVANATETHVELTGAECTVAVDITVSGSLHLAFDGVESQVLSAWLQQSVMKCFEPFGRTSHATTAASAVFGSLASIMKMAVVDRETLFQLLTLPSLSQRDPNIGSLLVVPAITPNSLRSTKHLPRPGESSIVYDKDSNVLKLIVRVIDKHALGNVDVALAYNTTDGVVSGWEKTVGVGKPGASGLDALFGNAKSEAGVENTCPASVALEKIMEKLKNNTEPAADRGGGPYHVPTTSPHVLKWCVRELLKTPLEELLYDMPKPKVEQT